PPVADAPGSQTPVSAQKRVCTLRAPLAFGGLEPKIVSERVGIHGLALPLLAPSYLRAHSSTAEQGTRNPFGSSGCIVETAENTKENVRANVSLSAIVCAFGCS